MATSSASSGVQKKERSGSGFRCRDTGDALILVGEVIPFISSASESQKKERSVMGFKFGVTGEEMTFVGDENQSDLTCCIGAVGTGTLVTF